MNKGLNPQATGAGGQSKVGRQAATDLGSGQANTKRIGQTSATQLSEEESPGWPVNVLVQLAETLARRFQYHSHLEDIKNVIRCYHLAISLIGNGHAAKPALITNLGISYSRRFERCGMLSDIGKALECQTRAVLLTPDEHPLKPSMFNNLGNAYLGRFRRFGDLPDLNKAIEYQTQAVPQTSGCRNSNFLLSLGNSYNARFEYLGDLADINKAIECHSEAVRLGPRGDTDESALLHTLGASHMDRFDRLGEPEDINEAVEWFSRAVMLTHDSHADKPIRLGGLGSAYMCRFERLGQLADMDNAIKCHSQAALLIPDDHAHRPTLLNNLGLSLLYRFERHGDVLDIDKSIECHNQAVLLTPNDNPQKAGSIHYLGSAYLHRFGRTGELADIDKAIYHYNQSLSLKPDDYKTHSGGLSNIGTAYMHRAERLGAFEDLQKAIAYQSQAVLLAPDSHSSKSIWLYSLGNSYLKRFERLGDRSDIDEAVNCQSQAVALTPNGHSRKPGWLDGIGTAYGLRFKKFGNLADCDKSIDCHSQALLLTADDHPHKPRMFTNLGTSFLNKFDSHGEVSCVDKAIECHNQAVVLTPHGNAIMPTLLKNLGTSYRNRFVHLGQLRDVKPAGEFYQRAAQFGIGNPRVRFEASRNWADMCHVLGTSPRPAYQQAIELIPELVWLGTTVDQRYDILKEVGSIATDAASWAIENGAYDCAVEWLEEGRSIVWKQILQLRTPFDDLSDVDPLLAKRLKEMGRDLEHAGSRSLLLPSPVSNPMDSEQDAQRHHRLASGWEQLLEQARLIPGFESFMRPRKAQQLVRAARDGPIVIINVHESRCDALIILPDSEDIAHVPLKDFSYEKAVDAREQLITSVQLGRDRGFKLCSPRPKPEDIFKQVLATLWSDLVKPILDFLGYIRPMPINKLPHITWCTTGELSFLPIHAAGCYDGLQPNAPDLVVSSYTPTLSILLPAPFKGSPPQSGILAVGQANTKGFMPLKYVGPELNAIKNHSKLTHYLQLDGDKATIEAVLSAMSEYSWVHLACHATQDPKNPAHSAFHLHDGPLSLETITKHSFKDKGLAFLSACQTATGDEQLPDEAIHLAAGMLMAGYPSVVATMWKIQDADGPEVAQHVYADLLADGKLDCMGAARALHRAATNLREKVGDDAFHRWVPFIHVGN